VVPPARGGSEPGTPLTRALGEFDRVPWLLRAPERRSSLDPQDREHDRSAALSARRSALVVLPLLGLAWLVVAFVADDLVVRAATVAVVIPSVVLAVRAAVTTQRFRQRWVDREDLVSPPIWLTLATVGSAVGAGVAVANLIADLQAGRTAVRALGFLLVFLGIAGWGAYVHLAGGRSVSAALRAPTVERAESPSA
jgi:hypothetical protein